MGFVPVRIVDTTEETNLADTVYHGRHLPKIAISLDRSPAAVIMEDVSVDQNTGTPHCCNRHDDTAERGTENELNSMESTWFESGERKETV